MKYFDIPEEELGSLGVEFTATEIWNQPAVWESTYRKFMEERAKIERFRKSALDTVHKIILTGAGTSAYIGYSLEGSFQRHTGITTVSIPTTHLVTHPEDYFDPDTPTLIISFARSGNSPESVAAVQQADRLCSTCYHLVITCDGTGNLARYKSSNPKQNFILPADSNDRGLAMTVSYTSMMLTGLLYARFTQLDSLGPQVERLVNFGRILITKHSTTLKEVASLDFNRAVFLGSGPLFGTSTESGLKLQELTDGNIICKNDSYLGFRHGPKAVIDEKTIVVFLFSCRDSVLRYERDLVQSMKNGKKALKLIGISECPVPGVDLDISICYCDSKQTIEEDFLAICSVLPAQMLGMFKSMQLGLQPDNPSVSGAISRVVKGVVIYE